MNENLLQKTFEQQKFKIQNDFVNSTVAFWAYPFGLKFD